MKDFQKYLFESGYGSDTMKQYMQSLKIFTNWMSFKSVSAESINYKQLLEFIDFCMLLMKNRCNPASSVNRLLVSVSHYYDYLRLKDSGTSNPVRNIRVKNHNKNLFHDLLHESELNDLYDQLEANNPRQIRNKVMLGLLIFQGATPSDLHRVSLNDVKFRKGTVLLQGDRKTNFKKGSTTRELPLAALQIIDLIEYNENIRPRILAGAFSKTPGRKPNEGNIVFKTEQLLLSLGGSPNLKNSLFHMFRNLKQINPQVKNATQIRQSIISSWLNRYDLRKVQYMAGHRYVSSTEYYKKIDLENLKQKVLQYHPLR